MRLLAQGHKKKQGKLFPTNCKTDLSKPCGMFFSKNCLFSRTHVVSLVVEEYLLFFACFFNRCPIALEQTV